MTLSRHMAVSAILLLASLLSCSAGASFPGTTTIPMRAAPPSSTRGDASARWAEAKKVLEELSRAGACTVDVTENGAFIYEFNGLMPREPARAALDP
ncbi:hypothetical protein ACN28E_08015 [Archangium lansingense]|uniref:hypothetical protein n=1 Tax=Archangium lansingense TaxID=2995310 RepID=UPI003B7A5BF7